MKRILLSLAALAALASCVKENTLAPAADQLTISAVSADTKTTLDGLDVVWEKTDKIAVVVNANEKVTAEFDIVESTLDGSAADFVGTMEWAKGSATSAYAVYPAAAVELTHTLPAAQTGEVSGLMLSAAALEVEDMQKGAATAEFHPALSLLQVAVPAGVKSVELTSAGAAIVGDATFEVDPATGTVALTVADGATKTVSISAEEELEAKTYPVVVYPGEVGDLTLKLVGAKGEEFVKTVSGITFVAAEARAINLMQIFQFAPEAIEVAPNGGNFEIPFTTTVEEVTVEENADWLESSVAVKGFQTGNVCLVAAANEGDETRTAEVTVSWGEGKSVTFTLTQPAIYRGFLNDADGNPIQWEETFKVYASETDANAEANVKATYKNVFTIALNDEDYTKGTYKIINMFKTDAYFGDGYQMITNKGGEYYADYADGKLTVKMAGAKQSYFFTKDVVLAYDETAQKFTSNGVLSFEMNTASSYNRAGVVAGYAAVVKVEEAPGGNNELDKFVGTWSETYVNKPYSWSEETIYENEFTVSVVDGKLYFEGMFLYKMGSTEYRSNYYGTPSADGTTITLEDENSNSGHGYFGPMAYTGGPIVLTVDGNTLTLASAYNGQVANYVATNMTPPAVSNPLDDFVGTWSETYVNKPYSWSEETVYESEFNVSIVDGKLFFEGMFLYRMYTTEYKANYYGTLSDDGTTITLEDENSNSGHGYFGPMAYAGGPIVLTVDGNTLTLASAYNGNVANYVATKQGAVEPEPEPEPEVPADPWTSDAVVTYDLPDGASSNRQVLRQIKYVADAENLYIKLQASATLFTEKNVAYLGLMLFDTTAGTAGSGYWSWWNDAKGDLEFNKEHAGTFNGTDLVLNVGDAQIEAAAETSDDLYVWTFVIPRSAHEVLALDKVYMGVLVMEEFEPCGAMPDKYGDMLEVTLP